MGHPEDWNEGLRTGAYHNRGTHKRKKLGKYPASGKVRKGIRRLRMEHRRGGTK